MINGKKGRYFSLLLVLVAGLVLSALSFRLAYLEGKRRIKSVFDEAATYRFKYIEDYIQAGIDALESFGDFYAASQDINRQEFDTFAQGIFIRYPYIFEFRWLERVSESERQDFEESRRIGGQQDFRIWELSQDGKITAAAQRQEYLPITYVAVSPDYSHDSSKILGLDAASLPERWQAMQIAQDSAKPASLGESRQYGEEDISTASRIYLPIYKNNLPHNTLQERRDNLKGFVVLLYQMDKMAVKSFEGIPLVGVDIIFYEVKEGEKKFLYFRPARTRKTPVSLSEFQQSRPAYGLVWSKTFPVADKQWLMVCTPSPEFLSRHRMVLPWIVLSAGIILTLLLVFYLKDILGRAKKVELLIEKRTQELRKAEEKYRLLFDSSRDAIMTIAPPDWNFISGNPAAIKMFGVKDEAEFTSTGPWKLSPEYQPDGELSSSKAKRMIETAMEKGSNFFEWRHKKLSGEEFPASVLLSRMESKDQAFLQANVRDISEHKQAEEALKNNEERLRTLISNTPGAIYRCANDPDRTMEFISTAIKDISGYPAADFIRNKVHAYNSIIYPQDRDYVSNTIEKALLDKASYTLEYRILHANGNLKWVYEKGEGIFSPENRLLYREGMIFDISDRKRFEEALKRAYQTMRDITENSPFGIYILNTEGAVEYVNPAMLEIAGATREQFMGLNMLDFSPYRAIGLTEKIKTCLNGLHFRLGPVEFTSYFTKKTTFRNFFGIPLEEDGAKKVLVIVEDLTERVKLERMKDEFVSTVSHELRTPLSIIKEGVSLILDGIPGQVNEKQNKILATTRDNIDRLTHIISNLLDISRIEAGRLELKKDMVEIVSLVQEVISSFESRAKAKGLELKTAFPAPKINIIVDKERIIQVFINLINNALKFTDKGYIEVGITDKKDELECFVSDSGRGITKEDISLLFSKFRQFGSRMPGSEGGTGLGLSISKGIVELHHGNIWVESEPGKGTKFIFTLPKNL